MDEFLEQFLAESRELIEQATDDLLALEEEPGDRERLDGAFRGFHTLKGAAGIMEFEAMGRALHAAEDVLSLARAGEVTVTPLLVGDCLACLDQVVQWLDAMETAGEAPADAAAAADAVIARFAGAKAAAEIAPAAEPATDWLEALLSRHPAEAARAQLAFRYAPPAESFFEGRDPLALVEGLEGLLALEITSGQPLPKLEDIDPFDCRLVFQGLLEAPPDFTALRGDGVELDIRSLRQATTAAGLGGEATQLIEAQVLMLRAGDGEGMTGRIGSARRVAISVLRRSGRAAEADRLARLIATQDAEPLAMALEQVLAGGFDPAGEPAAAHEAPEHAGATPTEIAPRALRVDVERVDALVNLTGELMVAKNALAHAAALAESSGDGPALAQLLKAQHAQLDRLVTELQRSVLNIRVLPLRQVFQRFPRLVREMVATLGKPARLVMEGEATEADKAIVENLFEPLLHILRNAFDHGVEDAQERARAGKSPSATVTLRARRDGDRVVVEVEDDGRGVDVQRVRAIAARRGVVTEETLQAMSDEEATGLIFAPGFSTAAEVTSLSGRGVGMDAVRTAIERLGGRVTVESRFGHGTLVRLTLPFTIVMSRVMTVEAGGQVFGIPMEAVVETVRLPRAHIQAVGSARAFVLRGRTLPLIDLGETLGRHPRTAGQDGESYVVVATAAGQRAGLEVDRLGDRLDVMLKPMAGLLTNTPGVAGTTLMGDGRVLLVLDLQELLQ